MKYFNYFLLFLFCCCTLNSLAQVRPQKTYPPNFKPATTEADTTDSKIIIVEYSDYAEGFREEGEEMRKLAGRVELRQDSVYMSCDTATIRVTDNMLLADQNVVIQQNDTLLVYSDSLSYQGNERIADLFYNVVLQNGDQQLFTSRLNYNLETKLAKYFTRALLTDGETQLQSKRGYYYVDTNDAFFKDSVVVVDPEFELRADTLQFNTDTKLVTFLGPTRIVLDESKIYCEAGFYNMETKQAEFRINPQFVKGEQQATADVIRYDGQKKEIILEGNARFEEGDRIATADRIRYDEVNEISYLEGNALVIDADQRIVSEVIVYDAKNGKYTTDGQSVVNDGTQTLQADQISFDDATGLGVATGNVWWQDTSTNVTITSEEIRYDKETDYLIASGGTPLMTSLIEEDTLFLVADTLVSVRANDERFYPKDTIVTNPIDSLVATGLDSLVQTKVDTVQSKIDTLESFPKDSMQLDTMAMLLPDSVQLDNPQNLPKDSVQMDTTEILSADSLQLDSIQLNQDTLAIAEPDTSRNVIAYGDVRIYKSDLQAVCDSLVFEGRDSVFHFYQDPLLWSDTTQFSADTISMLLEDGELDTIWLKNNSFIVNSPDEIKFNQIKGRDTEAYFKDENLYKVKVEGNAEFVYYLIDEGDAYIAANKALCSNMILNFQNNEVQRINCFPNPKANLVPIQKTSDSELELAGYGWYVKRRPMSKADLYKNRGKEPVVLDTTLTEIISEMGDKTESKKETAPPFSKEEKEKPDAPKPDLKAVEEKGKEKN